MPRKPKALVDLAPHLVAEARGWDPTLPLSTEVVVGWICDHGHEYEALIGNRIRLGSGCPFCAGKRPIVGQTDFASRFPDLASEADGWDPSSYTYGSGLLVDWKCSRGHRWKAQINSRGKGAGCPGCAGQLLLPGENDLKTRFPEISKEAHGWDPCQVFAKSNLKLEWLCPLGHKYSAMPVDRVAGNGCPICAGKIVLIGFNDLATLLPDVADQADGWDPSTVTVASSKRVSWKCELGHQWKSTVAGRRGKPSCPVCSNKKLLIGFNDLATTHPHLVDEAYGWDPQLVIAGSNKIFEWQCNVGHIFSMAPNTRKNGKQNCPFCSNHKLLSGFNDLATTHPDLSRQADGWDPATVIAGTHKKLDWRCENDHRWKAACNSRVAGVGCPSCASYGFDPGRKAWLYLIENEGIGMLQIGISNVIESRLSDHAKRGWEVIDIRGPMDGQYTYELEQEILQCLRSRGISVGDKLQGKFSGYTESWPEHQFNVKKISALLELIDR